jgi:DNA polymerase-3 subunit gamma/tau
MAYEVTANRRRPKNFDDLLGQDFVVATLKNMISTGNIAHAYLFAGPRGVGKTSAARILARALNNPSGPTAEPTEDFPGSEEIARGVSLDVIEIDGASNTSVNDVREIKDEVLFAPNSSRYKIYIIDEVHMLSNSAFNALLKTIEEPPPYIIFIFATTELYKVPATIRSRCQQFNFRLIPLDDIRRMLREVCDEMKIEAEADALIWIAKEATGSLRDAYTLFDQVAAFSDGSITLEKIRDKLGLVGQDRMNEVAEALAEGDSNTVMAQCEDIIASGVSVEQFIIDVTEYFRNLLFIRHGITKEAVLGMSVDRFSRTAIDAFSVTQLEKAVELLLESYRNIRYSLNQRFELELVLSRLAAIKDFLSSQEILARIEELRREALRAPAYSSGSENDADGKGPAEQPIERPVDPEHKERIIGEIKRVKPALASLLEKAERWIIRGDDLCIFFDSSFAVTTARKEKDLIVETFETVTGKRLKLRLEVEDVQGEEETAESDSNVELVKKVFRGEVIREE